MQSMLQFCHPDDLRSNPRCAARPLARAGGVPPLRTPYPAQGWAFGLDCRARPCHGSRPGWAGAWLSGVHWDITERKEAENRIRELNETLEERVAQRSPAAASHAVTAPVAEALAQNAAKATLSTLVASVTHELATPLGNSLITASTCSDLTRRIHDSLERGQMRRPNWQRSCRRCWRVANW